MNHEPTDAEVSAFIEQHPSGATADEIAEMLGVTRQRTFQILDSAVKKVRKQLSWRGIRSTGDALSL